MKSIKEAMGDYLRKNNGTILPSDGGYVVVKKSNSHVPLFPSSKWEYFDEKSKIRKAYEFRNTELRNRFIYEILEYESKTGHNAKIMIEEGSVKLELTTLDVGRVTEIDKEYASYTDLLYKDIVYNP